MRLKIHILIAIPTLILAQQCGSPEMQQEKPPQKYTIEQFMDTEAIGGSSFSPDESKILFSSNESGIYNCYEIPVSGGEPKTLTNSTDDYAFGVSYFPDSDRILFTSDKGGNEINHIHMREPDGSVMDLTPDSAAKAQFYGWAHDLKSFFFTTNSRDPRFFDLMELSIEESDPPIEVNRFASTRLYENTEGYSIAAISNSKRYVTLIQTLTTSSNHLFIHDRETGETLQLNDPESRNSYDPQYFSLDDRVLYFMTDEDSEFKYLRSYDLNSKQVATVETADWDMWYAYQSWTGKYRVIAINNDARTEIRIKDMETGKPVELPKFPDGDITSVNISRSEKLMTFYINSSTSPSNLFVYDFETRQYTQLSNTLNPEINQADLVTGEVIRYKSFDGLEIPALLYKPKGIAEGELRPAVLDIHGGPGGQRRLNYQSRTQYLVNHGYVVLSVNNRGSSGYGKTFNKADDKKHGDVDLKDCIWSKNFLKASGYVDPERIGIMGGSYGGYMVMAAMTFAPEEFNVGVNYFGVTNWIRTLKSTPAWWAAFRQALFEELGDPETDSVALYNKSPLFHAGNITKPIIVLQGANDPRVLQVESDEIVEAARNNGVPVEYVIFDDEGHGFIKKENQIEALGAVHEFLDTYLWGKEDAVGKESS